MAKAIELDFSFYLILITFNVDGSNCLCWFNITVLKYSLDHFPSLLKTLLSFALPKLDHLKYIMLPAIKELP